MTRPPVAGLTRLFVWSIVFEPMLYFVLVPQGVSGVTGNLARVLQAGVLAGVALQFISRLGRATAPVDVRLPAFSVRLYPYYSVHVALVALAGLLGFVSGAYALPREYTAVGGWGVGQVLNSAAIRPVFEYVTAIYYFVYFAILPRYFIRSDADLDYMFRAFRKMFVLSFVVGVIDYAWAALTNVSLVARQLYEGRMVGARFHGFAGEPRQAFPHLFLGLAMFHLEAWYRGRRFNTLWIPTIVGAALLTQSGSGFLGIAAFAALFALDRLRRLSMRRLLQLGVGAAGVVVFLIVARTGVRVQRYLEGVPLLWEALEERQPPPSPLSTQSDSIYPIYDLVLKAQAGNVTPIVLGSGYGSASAANNRLFGDAPNAMVNPNSQLVRLLHETGVVGTLLFILAFMHPLQRLTRPYPWTDRDRFKVLMLLMVGIAFGVRNPGPFLYLGAIAATLAVLERRPVPQVPA